MRGTAIAQPARVHGNYGFLATSKVSLSLDFVRPFTAHNRVDFTIEPSGDTTTVSWGDVWSVSVYGKGAAHFFNMDAMVGKDFEVGLANLKSAAEKSHASAILQ